MQIVFTDPPPRIGASQHPWGLIVEQLKARPGEWALCLKAVNVAATQINSGALNAFKPAGSFVARTVPSGKTDDKGRRLVDLYIKYLGEPPTESAEESSEESPGDADK